MAAAQDGLSGAAPEVAAPPAAAEASPPPGLCVGGPGEAITDEVSSPSSRPLSSVRSRRRRVG